MNAATLPATASPNEARRVTTLPAITPTVVKNLAQAAPPPTTTPRRPAVFKRLLLACVAVTAVAGIAKFGHEWWTVGRFMESTEDAYVGGDVTVIAPKVAGFIADIQVGDNQRVHAGDLLIKLDDRDYRTALARADANVASQQASLNNLDATRYLQESIVAQAQTGIVSAQAEVKRAADDFDRYQKLSAQGAVSIQSFQKADADHKQAVAAGEKASAALSTAQRQLAVIATQKMQAQAALDQSMAERDMARLNLSYTELRSPIDGIVGNRSARAGAYATIGSQLISVVPVRGLWIDANFKESQLEGVRPGRAATFTVDLSPGHVFHGHVASLAPATGALFSVLPPENATGNFTKIVQRVAVRIMPDDQAATEGLAWPGLSATVEVDTRAAGKESL